MATPRNLKTLSGIQLEEFKGFTKRLRELEEANEFAERIVQREATEAALRLWRRLPGVSLAEMEANGDRALELLAQAGRPSGKEGKDIETFRRFLASAKPADVETVLKDIENRIPRNSSEIRERKVK